MGASLAYDLSSFPGRAILGMVSVRLLPLLAGDKDHGDARPATNHTKYLAGTPIRHPSEYEKALLDEAIERRIY